MIKTSSADFTHDEIIATLLPISNRKWRSRMLVLYRDIEESIYIGDDVVLKILGIQDGQVKLGIEAPKEIPVHRKEIYDRIQLEDEIWTNH